MEQTTLREGDETLRNARQWAREDAISAKHAGWSRERWIAWVEAEGAWWWPALPERDRRALLALVFGDPEKARDVLRREIAEIEAAIARAAEQKRSITVRALTSKLDRKRAELARL